MKYNFKEEGLEIKLSWKERLRFLFHGGINMNAYQSYEHFGALIKLASDGVMKYGDSSKHGKLKNK
jgi:hypothetical protein